MNDRDINFILKNLTSKDNNYNTDTCHTNLTLLNKMWNMLNSEQQEEYCETFENERKKIKEMIEVFNK